MPLYRFLPVLLFSINILSCGGQPTKNLQGSFKERAILGFTQFPVYRSDLLLGFSETDGRNFNFRAWEGLVQKGKTHQNIALEYSGERGLDFSARFLRIAKTELQTRSISRVKLELVNPVEYTLRDPYPAYQYTGNREILGKRFIGALLRVDRINVSFYSTNGMKLQAGVDLKKISAMLKLRSGNEESGAYTAENAFIGYRLSTPPEDTGNLGAFTLEYQFQRFAKASARWEILNHRDVIRSGDYLKFSVRASHPAYLYVFNLDAGGNVHLMFPRPDISYLNPLESGRLYRFPNEETRSFSVDTVTGTEEFLLLVFRSRRPEMEALAAKVRSGRITREELHRQKPVYATRGVGQIREIKMLKGKTIPGMRKTGTMIKGLPSDYKAVFLLDHR